MKPFFLTQRLLTLPSMSTATGYVAVPCRGTEKIGQADSRGRRRLDSHQQELIRIAICDKSVRRRTNKIFLRYNIVRARTIGVLSRIDCPKIATKSHKIGIKRTVRRLVRYHVLQHKLQTGVRLQLRHRDVRPCDAFREIGNSHRADDGKQHERHDDFQQGEPPITMPALHGTNPV